MDDQICTVLLHITSILFSYPPMLKNVFDNICIIQENLLYATSLAGSVLIPVTIRSAFCRKWSGLSTSKLRSNLYKRVKFTQTKEHINMVFVLCTQRAAKRYYIEDEGHVLPDRPDCIRKFLEQIYHRNERISTPFISMQHHIRTSHTS